MFTHLEGVQAGEEGGEVGGGDAGQDQGCGVRVAQGQEAVAHQGATAAKHHAVRFIIKILNQKYNFIPIGGDDTVITDDPQVREEAPGVKLLDVAEQRLGVLLKKRIQCSLFCTRHSVSPAPARRHQTPGSLTS